MIGLRSFVGYLLVSAREAVEPGAGIGWVLELGMLSRARVWSPYRTGILVVHACRRWANWMKWLKLGWGNCARLMCVFLEAEYSNRFEWVELD